jgi:hypothetical protein
MSDGNRRPEIEVPETTTVAELAPRAQLSNVHLIQAAFHELGLLLTINEALDFEQSKALLAHFGFVARRAPPPLA